MGKTNEKRIQLLTTEEIKELYERPVFNQTEREEYFALDDDILKILNRMGKLENKLYLILLIGYFRAKPVVATFRPNEVKEDIDYLCKTYYPNKKFALGSLSKLSTSTRTHLINKMLTIVDFDRFDSKRHQPKLARRLQDVATISADPRYIFDECLAFFGQERLALAAYTTLQDLISETLSAERQRTERVLSQHMSEMTKKRLENILRSKGILNSLSAYKGSAKDFSPAELGRELQTHETIRGIYSNIKDLVGKLCLSQGNLTYYASIIRHRSIYKIRRYTEWQGLLYLVCYLYFRYRETNDKLVTAFCYLVRKQYEAAMAHAKQRIAEELDVIRDKLKYAGNILHYLGFRYISRQK